MLAEARSGMLADDLPDYLFARSTGHIGSPRAFAPVSLFGEIQEPSHLARRV